MASAPTVGTEPRFAPVVLSIPADPTLVVLVRSTVGHLGSRLGLPLQELDDLRLAANEACSLFLAPDSGFAVGGPLECRFTDDGRTFHLSFAADVLPDSRPPIDHFGWTLLDALVDGLRWESSGDRAAVLMSKRSPMGEG